MSENLQEDHRPWGYFCILSDRPDHKVKRITVYPGQRLSYQRHFRRSEHWYVLSGTAVVTQNSEEIKRMAGQAIDLTVGTWHRIRNPGPDNLVFIGLALWMTWAMAPLFGITAPWNLVLMAGVVIVIVVAVATLVLADRRAPPKPSPRRGRSRA